MEDRTEIIEAHLKSARNGTKRKGQSDLIKHLQGKRLPASALIRAKCYDCNGMGESDECYNQECPLYPRCPYKR